MIQHQTVPENWSRIWPLSALEPGDQIAAETDHRGDLTDLKVYRGGREVFREIAGDLLGEELNAVLTDPGETGYQATGKLYRMVESLPDVSR